MNKQLAGCIAALARLLCDAIKQSFDNHDGGALNRLMEDMRRFLPSVTPDQFADISAQLICCGVFATRYHSRCGVSVTRNSLSDDLPTNQPFLRALFDYIADPELDGDIARIVDQLIEELNGIDLDVFRHGADRQDALVYFYETFLAAYDPGTRGLRGVYYTPEPVVSYIVRSVDHLLRTDFGVPGGLAGNLLMRDIQILDPAMGTGVFLRGFIAQMSAGCVGGTDQWAMHDERHLLPCLIGCEVLPVPYLIAHLVLEEYLRLVESVDVHGGLHLCLGNVLDGELREMPGDSSIMVVASNPPYAGHSANNGAWIAGLLHGYDGKTGARTASYFDVDGQPLNERNSKWLNDDYVKFMRYAQWLIERAGSGILAFVTNHSYLDSPTFRGMRRSLMQGFNDIYVLDLHGNSKRNKRLFDDARDENVFDIQQGIAIGLFVKRGHDGNLPDAAMVHHAELHGSREMKYHWLAAHDLATTSWTTVQPEPPFNLFSPRDSTRRAEYERGWPITEIMPVYSLGVLTKRDALVIDFSKHELLDNIALFADPAISDAECAAHFGLPVRDRDSWDIAKARAAVRGNVSAEHSRPIAYRPFDTRYIYNHEALVARRNTRVMRHLEQPNRALVLGRQGEATGADSWDVLFVISMLADQNIFRRGGGTVFPLYLYPDARPNFLPAFIDAMRAALQMAYILRGKGDQRATFGPDDVFDYIYAVLHSMAYRTRYADFLKNDFPRVPLPANSELFRTLCLLGARLAALHVMELCGSNVPTYSIAGGSVVERIAYCPSPDDPKSGRVSINATHYFEGVSPDVWAYHTGGFQICHKWLKDRKGRTLSHDEIEHYRRMIAALAETIKVIEEIDRVMGDYPSPEACLPERTMVSC